MPAKLVEEHVLGLIRSDLMHLRDDDQLHRMIAKELERLAGGQSDARDQLSRQLASLDQQAATVRELLVFQRVTTAPVAEEISMCTTDVSNRQFNDCIGLYDS